MTYKLLRLSQIKEKTGLGRSMIYNYIQIGEFPKPLKLKRVALWVESEVDQWVEDLIKKRSSDDRFNELEADKLYEND